VVSLTSSSGGYINGRNSANLELLIDKTSSIYLYVKLKGVYISQLIRYARASSNYSDFLKRHLHLRNRLLDQGYKKIRLIRSLVLCVCFFRSLFVLLCFFFWPLCCMFFFDIRILITPLVSSSSSCGRS
jgi:hypothetical protein